MKVRFVTTALLLAISEGCSSSASPTYSVSGTITVSGAPLTGVTVSAYGAVTRSTITDSAGRYSLQGLAPGSYAVTPSYTGYRFVPGSQPVSITGADASTVDFAASSAPTPTSVQTLRTGQTVFYFPGDDGDLRKGVPWPQPRFTDNLDGTVTDVLTGIVWLKDAACAQSLAGIVPDVDGRLSWLDALAWARVLGNGSCSLADGSVAGDWRVPNINELESLVDVSSANPALPAEHPFLNVQSGAYHSSTTDTPGGVQAWRVYLDIGSLHLADTLTLAQVWPVRGSAGSSKLARTGQVASRAQADDGWFQTGAEWPSPRFVDPGDGTVRDQLTGLVWLRDANCTDTSGGIAKQFYPLSFESAFTWTGGLGDGLCSLSDGSQPGNWRLPNRRELQSIFDRGTDGPALTAGHPFRNVPLLPVWTSSSAGEMVWSKRFMPVWCVDPTHATTAVCASAAGASNYVWPVRDP